jgi:glutamine synthetase
MTKDGDAWKQCPRSFLRNQERKLLTELGIQPTIGFELEFQLLRPSSATEDGKGELVPVDSTLYSEVRALQSGASWKVLSQIVECLQNDLGIAVYQYHAESASGQFEISIGYDPNSSANDGSVPSLVDAVDQLVLARQTVHGIAAKHGLQATFVPKLKLNEPGSGAHIHLGLLDLLHNNNSNGGTSSAAAPNLFQSRTAVASAFIAGVLEELPGMLMLLAPSVNSFERLKPQCWAGAFNCYGFENREAAVRLIGSNQQDVARVDHFEIKAVDAIANPYVAVGALLAAGIAGIERKLKLPAPVTCDPAALDASKEKQPNLLPQSLEDAIGAFKEHSEFWNSVLSEEYASLLVRLREAENEFYGKLTRDELLQQLVRRY